MGLLTGSSRRRWRSENAETPDPRQQINQRLWLMRIAVLVAFAAAVARLQLVDA
jgi:hypothetical protein